MSKSIVNRDIAFCHGSNCSLCQKCERYIKQYDLSGLADWEVFTIASYVVTKDIQDQEICSGYIPAFKQ